MPIRVHGFQQPIRADRAPCDPVPRVTADRRQPCSCAQSPWCRGQDSADWATCTASCPACAPNPLAGPGPPRRRRRPREHLRG